MTDQVTLMLIALLTDYFLIWKKNKLVGDIGVVVIGASSAVLNPNPFTAIIIILGVVSFLYDM